MVIPSSRPKRTQNLTRSPVIGYVFQGLYLLGIIFLVFSVSYGLTLLLRVIRLTTNRLPGFFCLITFVIGGNGVVILLRLSSGSTYSLSSLTMPYIIYQTFDNINSQ